MREDFWRVIESGMRVRCKRRGREEDGERKRRRARRRR